MLPYRQYMNRSVPFPTINFSRLSPQVLVNLNPSPSPSPKPSPIA